MESAQQKTGQVDLKSSHAQIAALAKQGKLAEAEQACRELLDQNPGEPDTLTLLASLCFQAGDPKEAETLFRHVVELVPTRPLTWLNLAQFYQKTNRWADAQATYENGLDALPAAPELHFNLGQIYQRAATFDKAEACYRQVITTAPDHAPSWMRLGMTLLRQDKLDEAAAALQKAISLNPELAAAHGNLGNVYQKQDKKDEAEAAYDKAVSLNPKDAQSHVSLGLMKLRRGAAMDAAEIFERTLSLMGPERRAAAWLPFAQAESLGQMPGGTRAAMAKLIHRAHLAAPEGYANVAALNADLVRALSEEPSVWEPAGKATRSGSQTGLLLDNPREPYLSFVKSLRAAIDARFDMLEKQPGHPFLGQIPKTYQLDLWGTLLTEGGHQHAHIHVAGWMSGVYYVSLPQTMGDGSETKDGWIEFGHPPPDFTPSFDPHTLTFEPKEGDALFFPSYLFHRTLPFQGTDKRISLAFDVKPTSWR